MPSKEDESVRAANGRLLGLDNRSRNGRQAGGFVGFVESERLNLYRHAYRLCRNSHEAEDLVQETLAALYSNWWRVSGSENPVGYGRAVLVNTFRASRRRARWSRELITDVQQDDCEYQSSADEASDIRIVLFEALRELSDSQRSVVVLRYLDDLPVSEVSHILSMPTSTVASHGRRALNRLRENLNLVFHDCVEKPGMIQTA